MFHCTIIVVAALPSHFWITRHRCNPSRNGFCHSALRNTPLSSRTTVFILKYWQWFPKATLIFEEPFGVSKEALVGFKSIRLQFGLESDADQEQLASLINLTER